MSTDGPFPVALRQYQVFWPRLAMCTMHGIWCVSSSHATIDTRHSCGAYGLRWLIGRTTPRDVSLGGKEVGNALED
jgi:hypothetical protein